MKKLVAGIAAVAVLGSLAVAGSASAATGTAFYSFNFTPSGSLYKEAQKPGELYLEGGVTPNDDVIIAKPTVSQALGLGKGIDLVPHNNVTPVCTAITPDNANFNTEAAISKCPNSIVGEGDSILYLAGNKNSLVTDSVTISFNAGINSKGQPSQIIQGYSAQTNHGIGFTAYQQETPEGSDLVMDIPRLTADSSVPSFTTTMPGPRGQDPNYVQASCPDGSWTANADYTIAYRGKDGSINEKEVIPSPEFSQACTGLAGKAKFNKVKVKAKGKVKANKKGKFKVTVSNNGTATAKGVKLTAKGAGKGKAKGKNIAPGKSKTFTLKAKVKGKKGKKVTVKVKVTAKGTKAKVGKTKVKLK